MSPNNNNSNAGGKKPRWSHADKQGVKRGQARSGGFNRDERGGSDRREGGYQRRDDRGFSGERRGGFGGDRREGGFQRRDDRGGRGFGGDRREGGYNRDDRGGRDFGGDRRGGFNRDDRGGRGFGGDRREGGYNRDDRGGRGFGGDRREGGYQRRDDRGFSGERRGGFGGDRREGGFQRRDDRGGRDFGGRREGGYNRDDRGGRGFGGDRREGGYNRDDRGGRGFGGDRREGGYQRRDDRGFSGERRGGFNRDDRRDDRGGRGFGGDRRDVGFQRRDDRGGRDFGSERRGGFNRDDRRDGGFQRREERYGRPDRSFDEAPAAPVHDDAVESVTDANANVAEQTVEREQVAVLGAEHAEDTVHVEAGIAVDEVPSADAHAAPADSNASALTEETSASDDTTVDAAADFASPDDATAGFRDEVTEQIDESQDLSFSDLGLPDALVERMARDGITKPFPIQAATIPDAMAGKDVLGRGRTGSGKTLGFGLPMLARLAEGGKARAHMPRAIVLVPTRELAMQVSDALQPLVHVVGLKHKLVAGGMPYEPQLSALERGVDVLIATPGRLSDLIERGAADLSRVEIAVLDEADHMAEMGFLEAITEILDLVPEGGQRLLFSATLDRGIDKIVDKYLVDPVTHSTDDGTATVTTMEHHALLIEPRDKKVVTAEVANREGRTVVFVRTKMGADRVAEELREQGVMAAALHGGLNQGQRNRVLSAFKDGRVPVLVATDVAARGIHVDEVGVVLQVDPPADHKDYLHRAGRTARAGEKGTVITLALPHQRRSMQRLLDEAGVETTLVKTRPGDEAIVAAGGSTPEGRSISEDDLRRTLAPRNDRGGRGGRGYDRGGRDGGRGGYGGGRGGYGRGGGFDRGGRGRFNDRDDRGGYRGGRSDDRGYGAPRGRRDDIDGGFERENRRQSFGGGGRGFDRGGRDGNRGGGYNRGERRFDDRG